MAYPAQPKDLNNVPIGSPYIPGSPGSFAALKGSTNSNTDVSTNVSTAAVMALEQSLPLSGQLQNAQNGNANGSTLSMFGMAGVLFEVVMSGFTGSLNFEAAGPNGNYDPVAVAQAGTSTIATTVVGSTTTATHLYELSNAAGFQTVRARTSGVSAGTVTINAYASPVSGGPRAVNAVQAGTWTFQPGNTPNTTAWIIQPVAGTTNGSTPSHTMSAASTNATTLKASAGLLYGFCISNANGSARYFKLYNKASNPTVGTDTPVTTVQVPANGTVIRAYPVGMTFATGIAWAATTGIADNDTGSVGANDLSIDIDFK